MCVNAETSLSTFVISVFGSVSIIIYGNPIYAKENYIVGLFFIYVVFMQLLEYAMWIDLRDSVGLNRIASMISPVYIITQPVMLFIIACIVYRKIIPWVVVCNSVYLLISLWWIRYYYLNEKMITQPKNGYLKWKWIKYFPYIFGGTDVYHAVFAINMFAFFPWKYAALIYVLGTILIYLSYKITPSHYHTMWCLLSAYIPWMVLAGSYFV